MVVFSMLEKQYKFRSIISYKKMPKKFGNFISMVISLKTKGYNISRKKAIKGLFNFKNPTDYQQLE